MAAELSRVQLPKAIRSETPVMAGEFHTMHHHREVGFPGGRAQAYRLMEQHPLQDARQGTAMWASWRQAGGTSTEWTRGRASRMLDFVRVASLSNNPVQRELVAAEVRKVAQTNPNSGHALRLIRAADLLEHKNYVFNPPSMPEMQTPSAMGDRMDRQAGALDRGFTAKDVQRHAAGQTPGAGHNRPPSGSQPVGPMGAGKGKKFHDEVIDIETTGLRTKRRIGRFAGRGIQDRRIPLGLSQITRRIHSETGVQVKDAFTDILDRDMLKKHGVTVEQLTQGGDLPESLYREVTARASWRQGMKAPWDESVRESGSVLDGVFRRSAKKALEGNDVDTKSVLKGIITDWQGMAAQKKTVRVSGWNVQFDFSEIVMAMREHGLGKEIDQLISKNGIVVRELGENLHAMQFEHMLQSNWTPMMTDWNATSIAHQMGISPLDNVGLQKLGAKGIHPIRGHTALRSFMDDVAKGVVGDKSGFASTAANWVAQKGDAKTQAESIAHNLVNRLSKIKTYEDFATFAGEMQKTSHDPQFGSSSLYDVLGEWYHMSGSKAHILGDAETMSVVGRATGQWGGVNAFSMISGGKLELTAESIAQHADVLKVPEGNRDRLRFLVEFAHDSAADAEMSEIVAGETKRIRRDQHLSKIFMQEQVGVHKVRAQQRLGDLWQDVLDGARQTGQDNPISGAAEQIDKQLRGGGKRIKKQLGSMADDLGKGKGWGLMIAGIAGMYLLGAHNEVERQEPIQGMRTPEGQNDQISGIIPSNLPFSNISAFGSGYDQFYGGVVQSHMEKARIIRVLDGDTVVFMRDGRQVTARLAGINTPELNDPHMGHRARAERASQYLRTMVLGQEVTLRPQINDSVDSFGRELVHMDYDGMSVNRQMITAGFSGQEKYIPPAYVSPNEGLSFIKVRMKQGLRGLASMIEPFVGSRQVQPDPKLWEIFGTMGDVPYGFAKGYGGDGSPVMASNFRGGYGGYVQRLGEHANKSKVRDYQTQLGRLPGQLPTPKGGHAMSMSSHAERSHAARVAGY